MNFPNFITFKDFFNYYIAGFLWLLEIVFVFAPFSSYQKILCLLNKYQQVADKLGVVFLGLLLIILPYVVGFIATPIGILCTKLLRIISGDPKVWVTDYSSKPRKFHKGKRISQTKIRIITNKLTDLYGSQNTINENNLSKWFFQIRAIVINSKTESGGLATRAQDLVNFAESILLPFPVILFTIGAKSLANSIPYGFMFISLGIIAFMLLAYRYLNLRRFWVKHIYTSFLAISGQDEGESVENE